MNITTHRRVTNVLRCVFKGSMSKEQALKVFDRMGLIGDVEFQSGESCLPIFSTNDNDWYAIERHEVAL